MEFHSHSASPQLSSPVSHKSLGPKKMSKWPKQTEKIPPRRTIKACISGGHALLFYVWASMTLVDVLQSYSIPGI